MTERRKARVRWRVRRCPDGYLPVVLIGEERLTLGVVTNKAEARAIARTRAASVREAGNGY